MCLEVTVALWLLPIAATLVERYQAFGLLVIRYPRPEADTPRYQLPITDLQAQNVAKEVAN
jgi:hypothetical protein